MNLFYLGTLADNATLAQFGKEESRHISKVLRHQKGDFLWITNGKGLLFQGKITEISQKHCTVSIISSEKKTALPYKLHMAVAPTKQNDRYEWFLEKATEIGISSITPIICDHSERKVIKNERYEKIIESAMKQSLSCYKPILNEALPYADFIAQTNHFEGKKCIAHCEDSEKQLLKNCIQPKESILILIGPEGDFSQNEIDLALQNQFQAVSLGNSRLRTETAAIAACLGVSFVN
ncbi:MAG: 16S rRNA (uracil(1498)-N(3))-methyltransferase [Alteromonas sp.]|nr:16S rRNA (uracil(1498)-N(3))-methyltransferase [Alteromonas sp.]MAY22277.1 16S rRNA (uracil(1498)-N(3))-methyltransferase [Flavobacteriaceae bacterium]|tara:strand:- start:4364 stop:5071 length:708 start_codon:yes stop_codon:yes gene_type:complete